MIETMKAWFNSSSEITFRPHAGAPHVSKITRIQLASEVTPNWLIEQKNYENSREKFQNCPGMHDLMKAGYIIPAWDDIHIKANRAGTIAKMVKSFTLQLQPMNHKVVNGIAPIAKDMPLQVYKLNTPWSVTTKTGWSAMVMPATYHSPFLKDLYVYGGINDYEDFHILNFIFTPCMNVKFLSRRVLLCYMSFHIKGMKLKLSQVQQHNMTAMFIITLFQPVYGRLIVSFFTIVNLTNWSIKNDNLLLH